MLLGAVRRAMVGSILAACFSASAVMITAAIVIAAIAVPAQTSTALSKISKPATRTTTTPTPQRMPGYNYDEAKIAPYVMLDPLRMADGTAVTTERQWQTERRPQILQLFEENIFGRTPAAAQHVPLHAHVIERSEYAFGGTATREQVELSFDPIPGSAAIGVTEHTLRLLIYLPNRAVHLPTHRVGTPKQWQPEPPPKPVPVILGLNFGGNRTVVDDPAILPTAVWSKPKGAPTAIASIDAASTRGSKTAEWQVRMVLAHGYGFATAYYGDLEPDAKDSSQFSVRELYRPAGQAAASDAWGAIGAWAWGLSRAIDYLVTDPGVDPQHIAVTGHSRLGKAADWAAAQDPRIAALLSTESGHGGQSIQRRALGETVEHLEHSFPYWFCANYAQWAGHDATIPADGNLLLSLVAPRPLYVASAAGDEWSDPHGEFLSAQSASRVYRLLGKPALPPGLPMPAVDQAVGTDGFVAYHDRAGIHDVTAFDWQHYLIFLDRRWGTKAKRASRATSGKAGSAVHTKSGDPA
jgi:hypothetical protein